jgi:hypothetical protein
MFKIPALPAEPVAQTLDGHAQLLKQAVLAEAGRGHLHKLVDLHCLPAAEGAQRQPEGGRALALARAGMHDDQTTSLTLGLGRVTQQGWGFDFHGVGVRWLAVSRQRALGQGLNNAAMAAGLLGKYRCMNDATSRPTLNTASG